jgi:hypothetical protein
MNIQENTVVPIVIYQSADGSIATEVKLQGDNVWLSQKQMAELFDKNIRTVIEHIRNVFKEGELDEPAVIRNFRITAGDGKAYDTAHYNLDGCVYLADCREQAGGKNKSIGSDSIDFPCNKRVQELSTH